MALASTAKLEGKGIPALRLEKAHSWKILQMVKDKVATVGAVETRSMTKDRNESEEKEKITMECVPTSMFKGEEVSDEVMMQDEGVDS